MLFLDRELTRPAKTNNSPSTPAPLRRRSGPAGHHPHPGRRRRQAPALPAPARGGQSLPRRPRRALLRRARGADPLPAARHAARPAPRRGLLRIMVPMITNVEEVRAGAPRCWLRPPPGCAGAACPRPGASSWASWSRRRRRPSLIDRLARSRRFLQHRQQRPAAVLPGRRPRQRPPGASLRPVLPGLPAPAAPDRGRRPRRRGAGWASAAKLPATSASCRCWSAWVSTNSASRFPASPASRPPSLNCRQPPVRTWSRGRWTAPPSRTWRRRWPCPESGSPCPCWPPRSSCGTPTAAARRKRSRRRQTCCTSTAEPSEPAWSRRRSGAGAGLLDRVWTRVRGAALQDHAVGANSLAVVSLREPVEWAPSTGSR